MAEPAPADVEMREEGEGAVAEAPKTVPNERDVALEDIESHISSIRFSVPKKNQRDIFRVLRSWPKTRKSLTSSILTTIIAKHVPDGDMKSNLLSFVDKLPSAEALDHDDDGVGGDGSAMDVEGGDHSPSDDGVGEALPEVEAYLGLLVLVSLIDNGLGPQALEWATQLVSWLKTFNRRTLNPLAAKVFFYYSLAYEHENRLSEIRPTLLAAYRTASLHHDDETHITILNLLLRNYLHYNLYDQADKLQAKTTLREEEASSNQIARFKFFQGVIKALQLDYSGAYDNLQVALRRAPQHTAKGFRLIVAKFSVLVQLLMGEIPSRSTFRAEGLSNALVPYLRLTQAVRVGTLAAYEDAVANHTHVYRTDKTLSLVARLRNNVIKIGLRKINVAYSRISLGELAHKLNLGDVEDAELIVAKAIRDKVIDATINHKGGYVQSNENVDVYSTHEPQEAYHVRTTYCLKLHNEAVKAMRYPDEEQRPKDATAAKEEEASKKEGKKDAKETKKSTSKESE